MKTELDEIIVFFDDDCLLCNNAVQFLLERTPSNICFASLNSEKAKALKLDSINVDSIVVYNQQNILIKSTAVFFLISNMKWYWHFFLILKVLPNTMADYAYDFIAKNRKKWFRQNFVCVLNNPQNKNRFID